MSVESKVVLFPPASYMLRGWVSLLAALLMALAQIYGFSSTMVFIIYLLAFFWGGELFIRGALREGFKGYIGFNAFVSISAMGAFLFSLINNFSGVPVIEISGGNMLVPFTFLLANFIKAAELKSIGGAFRFIESLDNFISRSATLLEDGEEKRVFVHEVLIGDEIIIKTGERVPLDCQILEGSSLFDEHLLTGNVTLSARQKGDMIYASSVNKGMAVVAKALTLKNTTRIAKVLEAVKENERKKLINPSALESYAGLLILIFLFTALGLAGWIFYADNKIDIKHLVLAFLFTLSAAGPVSYMAALLLPRFFLKLGAAKKHIFINNPAALERLRGATKVFIDKTGTLTTGRLEVTRFEPAPGVKEADLLKAAVTAQQGGDNIFAAAIAEYARKKKIKADKVISAEMYPGFGAIIKTAKDTIAAGRRAWIKEQGADIPQDCAEAEETVFYIAKNGSFLGCVYFKDRLRPHAAETIKYLLASKREVCLVSGDSPAVLQAVAASAGIGEFYGNLFPQDKAAKIAAQENLGHRVAMAGDSFNDILALLQADISLAFCNAQNAFASWVDIRLGGKDFGAVKTAFELDSRQKNIERQNILISIIFSFAAIYAVLVLKQSAAWYHIAALVFGAVFIIIINCTRLYKI